MHIAIGRASAMEQPMSLGLGTWKLKPDETTPMMQAVVGEVHAYMCVWKQYWVIGLHRCRYC